MCRSRGYVILINSFSKIFNTLIIIIFQWMLEYELSFFSESLQKISHWKYVRGFVEIKFPTLYFSISKYLSIRMRDVPGSFVTCFAIAPNLFVLLLLLLFSCIEEASFSFSSIVVKTDPWISSMFFFLFSETNKTFLWKNNEQ